MQEWLVNGQPGRVLDVADRGLAYGDGLFETIAWRNGVPRFFDRHMARLLDGCRRLSMPEPPAAQISDEILQLAAGRRGGTAKVIITRGRGARGYRIPAGITPSRIVGFAEEPGSAGRSEGVRIMLCRTMASSNTALAGLKTLNRLDNVLARSEWQDNNVHEGLMRDSEGDLVGGTMSNLFLVQGGRLFTPSLERCGIRGVMRGVVLELAREAGISAAETCLSPRDLDTAEELFLTNALIGIWPVIRCGDHVHEIGPLTSAISQALAARGVSECAP